MTPCPRCLKGALLVDGCISCGYEVPEEMPDAIKDTIDRDLRRNNPRFDDKRRRPR